MQLEEVPQTQHCLAPVRPVGPARFVRRVESVLEGAADVRHHRFDVADPVRVVERPSQRDGRSLGSIDPNHHETPRRLAHHFTLSVHHASRQGPTSPGLSGRPERTGDQRSNRRPITSSNRSAKMRNARCRSDSGRATSGSRQCDAHRSNAGFARRDLGPECPEPVEQLAVLPHDTRREGRDPVGTRMVRQTPQQHRGDAAVLVAIDDRDRRLGRSGLVATAHVASETDARRPLVVERDRDEGATVGAVDVHQEVEETIREVVGSVEEPQPSRLGRQLQVPLRQLVAIRRQQCRGSGSVRRRRG